MQEGPAAVSRAFLVSIASESEEWCGREESNFHGFYPTATSTLRVYQFRHGRETREAGM